MGVRVRIFVARRYGTRIMRWLYPADPKRYTVEYSSSAKVMHPIEREWKVTR
jgi:hypothetical protein